jgi:hypothetical protein
VQDLRPIGCVGEFLDDKPRELAVIEVLAILVTSARLNQDQESHSGLLAGRGDCTVDAGIEHGFGCGAVKEFFPQCAERGRRTHHALLSFATFRVDFKTVYCAEGKTAAASSVSLFRCDWRTLERDRRRGNWWGWLRTCGDKRSAKRVLLQKRTPDLGVHSPPG